MKKEITYGQIIGTGVGLVLTMVAAWITLNNKVSVNEAELKALQLRVDRIERLEAKIDDIRKVVNDIAIKVENKKDRDK